MALLHTLWPLFPRTSQMTIKLSCHTVHDSRNVASRQSMTKKISKSQNSVSTLLFQLRKILSKIWTWTLRSVTINLRHTYHNCEYKTKIFLLRWNLGVKTADLSWGVPTFPTSSGSTFPTIFLFFRGPHFLQFLDSGCHISYNILESGYHISYNI